MLSGVDIGSAGFRAVVIGASAGGTDALGAILPALPRDFAVPIFMVVHIPKGASNLIVDLLSPISELGVVEAEDKIAIRPGTIYVAPPDYHLLVETDGHLSLSISEPVHFSRPSIDVLFESAADVYGAGLTGVLLSGASEDGALGMVAVKKRGGRTLVQDPQTAQMPTMPLGAIRRDAADFVLPPDAIARRLRQLSADRLAEIGHPREGGG